MTCRRHQSSLSGWFDRTSGVGTLVKSCNQLADSPLQPAQSRMDELKCSLVSCGKYLSSCGLPLATSRLLFKSRCSALSTNEQTRPRRSHLKQPLERFSGS